MDASPYTGWFPFWFWNDTLTESEIRWQIAQMAEQGLRGFVPSPRQGLKQPYLSEVFFQMVAVAIDAAKQHGMVVHLYDELPYPSGAAGGEVLLGNPHFYATTLVQRTFDVQSAGTVRIELPRGKILNCIACPLNDQGADWSSEIDLRSNVGVVLTENSYQEVGLTAYNRKRFFSNVGVPTLEAKLPAGRYQIFVSAQVTVENHKYYFQFVDVLNPAAVREFLHVTHDRYYQRFGSEFGKTIRSIFADETAPVWSERLPAEFFAKAGYELPPLLPALQDVLHPQHAKVSGDFHRVKYELFVEAFEKPYSDWCREHGIAYWGEKPLLRLAQLKFSDVPGCDAGHVKAGAPLDMFSADLRANPRAAASAMYFYDKSAALCECYHSLGWGATLQDLKRLADGLLLAGINCFVPHAFFYTTHGLQKHDAPPSMFFQMPYWKFFGQMVERTQRVLKEFEGTHIAATVLVVDPTPGVPTVEHNREFVRLQNLLVDAHVDYLLVDVDILRSGRVQDGQLLIKDLKISLILVPPMLSPEPQLVTWLSQFETAGGRVVWFDRNFDRMVLPAPSLQFAGENLHVVTRKSPSRTLWFVQNVGNTATGLVVQTDRLSETVLEGVAQLQRREDGFHRQMQPHESVLLSSEARPPGDFQTLLKIELPSAMQVTPLNANLLPLRNWKLTLISEGNQSAIVQPAPIIYQLEKNGLRFAPRVSRAFGSVANLRLPTMQLRYVAEFENIGERSVQLVMEPGSVAGEWGVQINQSPLLEWSNSDHHIRGSLGADVSHLLRQGTNTVQVDVTTDRMDGGLLNCLYLAGDFGVKLQPLGLVESKTAGKLGQWENNGLPFFAGVVEYRCEVALHQLSAIVELPIDSNILGDDACEVSFNSGPWHAMLWTPRWVRVNPGELRVGENQVRIRVYTTLIRAFEAQRFDLSTHRTVDVINGDYALFPDIEICVCSSQITVTDLGKTRMDICKIAPKFLIRAVLLMALGHTAAWAADVPPDSPPDLSKYTQSFVVPFANTVNYNKLTTMLVRVSINGGPAMSMQVDTGSVGVIAGAADVPNIDPKAPAGSIAYSSSGVEIDGVWTPSTITFLDSKDDQGHPLTAQVPVLAAQVRKTSGQGVNAFKAKSPVKNPKIYMFGVGFGRGKEAHPEKNPFLNLTQMRAGTMRRGYAITPSGYTLGLTPAVADSGYVFQSLKERTLASDVTEKNPGLKDWETAPGSFSVNSKATPMGVVLMDTGITNMILEPNATQEGEVPDGSAITVNLLGGKLHYSFKTGDKENPLVPKRATYVKSSTGGVYINTGLRALAGFDYLFDADGGYLALKPLIKRE